jgi:hypothetical protein
VPLPSPHTFNGSLPPAVGGSVAAARDFELADSTGAHLAIGRRPLQAVNKEPTHRADDAQRQPADRELLAKRDRLIERFAAMQLDLGGVYYEMAIRDHIQGDVLIRKAAEMQRVDAELRQVEGVLDRGGSGANRCPACEALYSPGSAFCSHCGSPLAAGQSGR